MSVIEPPAQQEFSALFAAAEQALYGFVFSLLPHRADADDVLQETVGLLWEHFESYDPARPFLPWACKFAYRQVLKHRRRDQLRRRHFEPAVIEQLAEEAPQRSDHWWAAHQRAVEHCLRLLPPGDQRVVRARYFGDVKLAALSEQLGRTANALSKQLQRIRLKLHGCIARELEREGVE